MSSTNGGRNFDQVHPEYEDRKFTLGAQDFHWMPMHWRVFGTMVEDESEKFTARRREHEAWELDVARLRKENPEISESELPEEPDNETLVESYEQLIDGIARYLDPSEVDRFNEVVNDPEKRVSHVQLSELRDWIRDVANNRPTEEPSPSEPGPGQIEATSQVA